MDDPVAAFVTGLAILAVLVGLSIVGFALPIAILQSGPVRTFLRWRTIRALGRAFAAFDGTREFPYSKAFDSANRQVRGALSRLGNLTVADWEADLELQQIFSTYRSILVRILGASVRAEQVAQARFRAEGRPTTGTAYGGYGEERPPPEQEDPFR